VYSGHTKLSDEQQRFVRSWLPDETDEIIQRLSKLDYLLDIMNTRLGGVILFFYPSFSAFEFDSMVKYIDKSRYEKFEEVTETALMNGRGDKIQKAAEKSDVTLKFRVYISRALLKFKDSDKAKEPGFAEQLSKLEHLIQTENAIVTEYLDKRHMDNEKTLGEVARIYERDELAQFGVTYTKRDFQEEDGYGRYTHTVWTYYYKNKSFSWR
jgi:hypothetical protein